MQKTSETLQSVADLYDDHVGPCRESLRRNLLSIIISRRDALNLLPTTR
jgi:hypothetical protein